MGELEILKILGDPQLIALCLVIFWLLRSNAQREKAKDELVKGVIREFMESVNTNNESLGENINTLSELTALLRVVINRSNNKNNR